MGLQYQHPPVIIIGMHRSGTSMIARLLEELGLFMGWRKQSDHESPLFIRLNDWLMSQSGAAWDQPTPVLNLINNPAVCELAQNYLETILKSPHVASYLGLRGYLRYRSPGRLPMAWGWKDPRNTYTLPLWLNLFPQAMVIHIYRDGIDVSNSLHRRGQKQLAHYAAAYRRKKWLYYVKFKRHGFTDTLRYPDLEQLFGLWEDYISQARSHVARLGAQAIEVKYEEFLADPAAQLGRLASFCGLPAGDEQIQAASGKVRRERAYAYRQDPALSAFAASMHSRLAHYGYGAENPA
jgi:hypothetical protein